MTPTASKSLPASLLALALLATPALAQRGKPSPPPPPGLTMTFADDTGHNVTSDGLFGAGASTYPADTTDPFDGAFINTSGGADLNLAPGSNVDIGESHDRSLRLSLDVSQDPAAASCPLPSATTAAKVDFRFNVADDRGNTLGIESMGNGVVPLVISNGAGTDGYRIGAVLNFTPDSQSSISNVSLLLGRNEQVSLERSGDTWTFFSNNASVLVQCTVLNSKGRKVMYEMGPFLVAFQVQAVKQ